MEAQTFTDFEVLVNLDNPSLTTEFSKIELMFSHDDRFIFLRNKRNLGVAETQKISLNMSKGSYLAFQAEDNLLHAEYLSKVYEQSIKDNSEEFISFCSANIQAQKIFSIKHVTEIAVFKAHTWDEVCDYLLIGKSVFFAFDTVCMSRNLAISSFSMALKYSPIEDLAMIFFSLQKQVQPVIIEDVLVTKLFRKNSYSNKIKFSEVCRQGRLLTKHIKNSRAKKISELLHSNNLLLTLTGAFMLHFHRPNLFWRILKQRSIRLLMYKILS